VLSRQQGQQRPLPGSPALIFFLSLTGGSYLVGHIKEKICSRAESPYLLVLNASFLQQNIRPARQQTNTMRQLTDAGGIHDSAGFYGKHG